jgi:hypothetical protein
MLWDRYSVTSPSGSPLSIWTLDINFSLPHWSGSLWAFLMELCCAEMEGGVVGVHACYTKLLNSFSVAHKHQKYARSYQCLKRVDTEANPSGTRPREEQIWVSFAHSFFTEQVWPVSTYQFKPFSLCAKCLPTWILCCYHHQARQKSFPLANLPTVQKKMDSPVFFSSWGKIESCRFHPYHVALFQCEGFW